MNWIVTLSLIVSAIGLAQCSLTIPPERTTSEIDTRVNKDLQYLAPLSQRYLVDSSAIPNVTFDTGENYAGLMVVGPANRNQSMFFWFYPTENPAGKDDFIIWFNGGPGCSSMEGFTQENGPWSWKPGTFRPTPNAYSWHKLANVVWVEYPIGTGFSSGPVTAKNNDEAAAQFAQFWWNFSRIFGLKNKKIYLSGESYAGVHIPYVGAAMLKRNDTVLFNLKGALMYDAVLPYSDGIGHDQRVLPAFARYWGNMLGMSPADFNAIQDAGKRCGHDDYLEKYLAFPPPPRPFPGMNWADGCDVVSPFFGATVAANPCFNQYHVADMCPIQWDIDGYPNMPYIPDGAKNWFNQADVRRAIHVPIDYKDWNECSGPVYNGGPGYDSGEHERRLQTVVEITNNLVVGSGLLDMVIPPNVTALAIQMLKWNGQQGFQTQPQDDFILPGGADAGIWNLAPRGYQGTWHKERGLTHVTVKLAGHMVPQYAPSAAFRHVEYLLGRTDSLGSGADYTINISNNFKYPY